MSNEEFFRMLDKVLALPYQQSPNRYDEAVSLLTYWLETGYDDTGNLFSSGLAQRYADYRQRLEEKRAEDLDVEG